MEGNIEKAEKETWDRGRLAERLAGGDPTAPRDLVRWHYPELYRYALGMLREPAVAQDATQASFEKALAALGRYPEERIRNLALRPWLYKIVLNVAHNTVRDRKRETLVAEVPEKSWDHPEMGESREAWLDVAAAMGHLPERQREALALRYLADLPYAGISEATGWPEGTAKTLVRRGLGRLRSLLDTAGRKDA